MRYNKGILVPLEATIMKENGLIKRKYYLINTS